MSTGSAPIPLLKAAPEPDQVAERLEAAPPARSGPPSLALPIVSIVVAVPLTAIAAGTLGLVGVLVVWLGIVLVNVVNARAS